MCGGGGSNKAVEYQMFSDHNRKKRIAEAVDEIYKVFGFDKEGNEIAARPVLESTEELPPTYYMNTAPWAGGYYDPNAALRANQAQVTRDQEAYDNKTKWDDELGEVFDAVFSHHKTGLDKGRREISDATTTQMLRQGMGGSHLGNQYKHAIDSKYLDGLGQIHSFATNAKEQAKTGLNNAMTSAISQVHADNFEAANAATLNSQVANSIDSAQSQANAQNLGNLFTDLADAYERRLVNKGTTLANQSYYSTPGSSGTVTGK